MKILILLLLSSCSFIPDLKPIKNPVNDKFTTSKSDGAETSAQGEAAPSWEHFYRIPELQALIRIGLDNNRDLRNATLAIEETRAMYDIQKSQLFPQINLNGSYTKQHFPSTAINQGRVAIPQAGVPLSGVPAGFTQELYGINVGITNYELDFWGRIRSLNEGALQRYLSTQAQQDNVRIMLISDIATTYFSILADRHMIEIAKNTAAAQKATTDYVRNRVKVGVQNELELMQAETLLESARVDEVAFTRKLAVDTNALQLLLGVPVRDLEFKTSLQQITDQMTKLTVSLDSKLLLQRPDVKASEHQLIAANADIGAARAAFFPTVSLTTQVGRLSRETTNLFDQASEAWTFSPSISLPIFTGGRLGAGLDVAKVRKDRRIAEYEQTIQRAFREVSDALVSNEKLSELNAIQQRVLKAADRGYMLSRERYRTGVDPYIIELDSRRALYRAQTANINQQLEYFSNLTYLYRSLGGGVGSR
jgi:multidrug efflux system outer membrane protein